MGGCGRRVWGLVLVLTAVTALWAAGAAQAAAKPNLIVSAETVATSVSPDVKMTATATVKNRGRACAGASRTDFFASADKKRSGGDVRLNKKPTPALCRGKSKQLVQVLDLSKLPADLHSFFVVACADAAHAVHESNESNNCRASRQLSLPYRVLVVTGPNSELNTAWLAAVRAIGNTNKAFAVQVAATASQINVQFTPTKLAGFRVVVFLWTGTSGFLSDSQKVAFEDYFHQGGGFVGIGGAIQSEPTWSFYDEILGTRQASSTSPQLGTIKVADRVHEATKNLPEYWDVNQMWPNFTSNVRGHSHVLATVVEEPFGPQPQGQVLHAIGAGTMGADHPVAWCKDYKGGRSFYSSIGDTAATFAGADYRSHVAGALKWAAGLADPHYSDCGATVLANYEQVKLSGPPNLSEPIGFDQLPDGRIIQTARTGTVRLHDPETGMTQVIADFADPALPTTQRLYTFSEDGLYGPAVDNDFATNHWVYLYYSPQTVTDVKLSDGSVVTQTTPATTPPNSAPTKTAWDPTWATSSFRASSSWTTHPESRRISISARSSRS